MSTSPAPRSPGSGSTRQLLDDLDALMERMLALPVNQLEDEPASAASTAPVATLTVSETAPSHEPAPEPEPEPIRPTVDSSGGKRVIAHPPTAALPAPHTTEEPPRVRPAVVEMSPPDKPAVLTPPRPLVIPAVQSPPAPLKIAPFSVPPPIRRSPLPTELTPPAPPAPTKVPFWSRFRIPDWAWRVLLWSNRTFDRCTRRFGNPGRWLRGARGRAVLGWVGLALWSVALALVILRLLG